MSEYSQPEFYRFSEDSLRLVNFVASREHLLSESVADLGCGCGVIGIEFARKMKPKSVFFLEAQDDFFPHLKTNLESLFPETIRFEVVQGLFSEVDWTGKNLDLILCNPPFYLPGEGEVSKDPRRHQCRTFQHDNWEELLNLTKRSLSPKGRAYFVIPHDEKLLQKVRSITESVKLLMNENRDRNLCYLSMRLNEN